MTNLPTRHPPALLWQTLCAVSPLSEMEIEAARPLFKYRFLPRGSYFLQRGEVCTEIAFIEDGLLRAWYLVGNREITRTVDHEGEFCTAIASFIRQEPSEQTIQALVDTRVWCISHADLESLYQRFSGWQKLGRKFFEQLYINLEKRVITLLSTNARQRYLQLLQEEPEIVQQVPLKYLASILGVKPETLSRIRKQFVRSNETRR